MRGTGTFTVAGWKDSVYDDADGTKLGRASHTKTFAGDLVGTSTVEILTAVTTEGPSAYVGLERITGVLHGKAGSFVVAHSAVGGAGRTPALPIVPRTGTGELKSIHGEIVIERRADGSHVYEIDYELE